jgi:hypothetical protein
MYDIIMNKVSNQIRSTLPYHNLILILGYCLQQATTHALLREPWLIKKRRKKKENFYMYMYLFDEKFPWYRFASGWAAKWRANRLSFRCDVWSSFRELRRRSIFQKIHCGRAACKLLEVETRMRKRECLGVVNADARPMVSCTWAVIWDGICKWEASLVIVAGEINGRV